MSPGELVEHGGSIEQRHKLIEGRSVGKCLKLLTQHQLTKRVPASDDVCAIFMESLLLEAP